MTLNEFIQVEVSDDSYFPLVESGGTILALQVTHLVMIESYYLLRLLGTAKVIVCKPKYDPEYDLYWLHFYNRVYKPLKLKREDFEVLGMILSPPYADSEYEHSVIPSSNR